MLTQLRRLLLGLSDMLTPFIISINIHLDAIILTSNSFIKATDQHINFHEMQTDVSELLLFTVCSNSDLNLQSIELSRLCCQQFNGKLINCS